MHFKLIEQEILLMYPIVLVLNATEYTTSIFCLDTGTLIKHCLNGGLFSWTSDTLE